jgi:hypothetical protein
LVQLVDGLEPSPVGEFLLEPLRGCPTAAPAIALQLQRFAAFDASSVIAVGVQDCVERLEVVRIVERGQ